MILGTNAESLKLVGAAGVEPATLGLEIRCSIRLSYAPAVKQLITDAYKERRLPLVVLSKHRVGVGCYGLQYRIAYVREPTDAGEVSLRTDGHLE